MTNEEWELHPDRFKVMCENIFDSVKELEKVIDYYDVPTVEGNIIIGSITELNELYGQLYKKYSMLITDRRGEY